MKVKKVLLPNGTVIGILGGGQLGRMIAFEAKKMGYDVICMDPTPNSPCGQVADEQIVAELNDIRAAIELAKKADVVVYEFENIDANLVEEIENKYYLPQGSKILKVSQDRSNEKQQLRQRGFPVVPFYVVENAAELKSAVAGIGYPCVLKTVRGGYDGKGQYVFTGGEHLKEVDDIFKQSNTKFVLEKYLNLNSEISVIVARKENGEMLSYPVVENIHRENILHMSIVPARVSEEIQFKAVKIAKEIADEFKVVGLLVVEFFVVDDHVIVNELAPRPHNSGHYTLDACYVSQFEQLIRAVCNLPFGSTDLLTPAVMVNILGKHLTKLLDKIPTFKPDVKVHLYGKRCKIAEKRKMGHLTIMTADVAQTVADIEKSEIWS
ncbi:5-(carboxyamino)imidazole ribonucleotide synthase [Peptococcaceae bacterium]|nr:5-(carboxyamino)imidazole ribonucleotide synthase [Peptococcaceae bacterium]